MLIKRLINKIFKNNQRQTTGDTRTTDNDNAIKRKREVEEQTEIEIINARLTRLEGDLEKAVTGYKRMLIQNNPDVLPELIGGESVEAVEHSLAAARQLTDRIREKLEQQTAAERIPGGSPPRAPPDTENLSSYEKILYGLEQK